MSCGNSNCNRCKKNTCKVEKCCKTKKCGRRDCDDCGRRGHRGDRDRGRRDHGDHHDGHDGHDNDENHAYVADTGGQEVADGDRLLFSSTGPTDGIDVAAPVNPGEGTTLTIGRTGIYAFTYTARGTTPLVEGGSPPIVLALGKGTAPAFNELPLTRFSSLGSADGGTQSVVGSGEVCLNECDVVTVRNLSGDTLTLSDDEAIDASLDLHLIEEKDDCGC